jgi:hypothetical protein
MDFAFWHDEAAGGRVEKKNSKKFHLWRPYIHVTTASTMPRRKAGWLAGDGVIAIHRTQVLSPWLPPPLPVPHFPIYGHKVLR